jgi:hypothetical protein
MELTKSTMHVWVERDRVRIGDRFAVTFERTLRIPDDGPDYPLPPGLGAFPIHRVEDYPDTVPARWRERGGVFLPMYQREAMWLSFEAEDWKPNAVKIGVGGVNAVSGKAWDTKLRRRPQDYLVCPDQPWLDGINAGDGFIRQFVAMPLGAGYTVEAQVTGKEEFGGLQIVAYEPKPGRFPDAPPQRDFHLREGAGISYDLALPSAPVEMGLGAGGRMRQKIYPDPHGVRAWDQANHGTCFVHIVNSADYRAITGLEPPPTPIDAKTYTDYGLPWFDLYDEARGDVAPPLSLKRVKSVGALDQERGAVDHDAPGVEVPEWQIKKLGVGGAK